ncbi:MAG: DUF6660 family protein [Bacteroidota bacterium]
MKLIYAIISIYVLCLAVYPCQDNGCGESHESHCASIPGKHDAANDVGTTGKHDLAGTHHSGGKDECHHCSPFCICNCCQGHTVVVMQSFFELLNIMPAQRPNAIISEPSKGIAYSIWQPPKVS